MYGSPTILVRLLSISLNPGPTPSSDLAAPLRVLLSARTPGESPGSCPGVACIRVSASSPIAENDSVTVTGVLVFSVEMHWAPANFGPSLHGRVSSMLRLVITDCE
ncbi:Uncharacterised protein [Mycobacteroides abscessus subsp. abscessus]|nr:Uncharacterised protein [Mycobacteroides abscessus subsp. abscessus]